MRRAWLWLLLAGCLSPDDILLLRGAVEGGGINVALYRGRPDAAQLVCDELKLLKEVQSEAGGEFVFEVFRAQAMRLDTFEPFCFEVRTSYPSGTEAWAPVRELYAERKLPRFPDWTPQLRVEDGHFALTPAAVREDDDRDFVLRHAVELHTPSGRLAWRQSDDGSSDEPQRLTADPRVVEEFAGALTVRGSFARAKEEVEFFGDLRLDWSPVVQVRAPGYAVEATRVPLSRGLSCQADDGGCPWTDGLLTPAATWRGELPTEPSPIMLSFDAPVTPTLLVTRGVVSLSGFVAVYGLLESSGQWAPIGHSELVGDPDAIRVRSDGGYELPPAFAAVRLDAGQPVTAIELRAGAAYIDEVSVW